MKVRIRKIAMVLFTFALGFVFTGCANEDNGTNLGLLVAMQGNAGTPTREKLTIASLPSYMNDTMITVTSSQKTIVEDI